MTPAVEARAADVERRLLERRGARRDWEKALVDRILGGDADLRSALFRFVDVLPALEDSREVALHLREHIPPNAPWPLRFGRTIAGAWLCHGAVAATVRRAVRRVAARFVAGATPADAVAAARALAAEGCGASLDLLGEAVVSSAEADAYMNRYLDLIDALASWDGDRNVSVKLSALTSRLDPLDPDGASRCVRDRLRPIAARARRAGVFVHVDAEEYETRDLTWKIVRDLLDEEAFRDWADVGVVVQAYQTDADEVLDRVLAWARRRKTDGADLTVRLVRGAYWDVEVARALQAGRAPPVWRTKAETDACYDRLVERCLAAHRVVRTAVATHNVRSLARAVALAEDGVPPGRWEVQMLHGMGGDLRAALLSMRIPVRVYVPIGGLLEGIGYLVRRLLENASNESLLGANLTRRESEPAPAGRPETAFAHAPLADWAREADRLAFRAAIEAVERRRPFDVPPAASPADVDAAVVVARRAAAAWGGRSFDDRAAILDRAADLVLERRWTIAAVEVLEAGKPWREADADVCEAVDHLRLAAAEARRLGRGARLEPEIPGERNILVHRPRGVVGAITPWNFPVAIPAGIVGPALAAGNAVVWKPAEESPASALALAEALREAGVPEGALLLVPGAGEVAGAALARHPGLDAIAFTGSRAVGLAILGAAPVGARGPRRVVLEMGGKNAIIVDSSADLDEAVRAVVASAFDYAGQKCSACSRLIVVDGAERVIERVVEAAASRRLGPAADPATEIPPVISAEAWRRIMGYVEIARREGRILLDRADEAPCPYVGPVIVENLPADSPVLRDEIFGPVLAVVRARNFDQALAIAADSDYALTAGVFSRTPSRIEAAVRKLAAGNVYINRRTTGAVAGRHPFGGHRFSGTGEKAGGPGCLEPYVVQVTISENTVRHGFVPA